MSTWTCNVCWTTGDGRDPTEAMDRWKQHYLIEHYRPTGGPRERRDPAIAGPALARVRYPKRAPRPSGPAFTPGALRDPEALRAEREALIEAKAEGFAQASESEQDQAGAEGEGQAQPQAEAEPADRFGW